MEFEQKRFSARVSFSLGDETFAYSLSDRGGSRSFSVEYAGFSPTSTAELVEKSEWFRNVGLLWVLIGGLIAVGRYLDEGVLGGSLWLTLGVGCLIFYRISAKRFTLHETQAGPLCILRDSQYERILTELRRRRVDQLRRWYGQIDLANDPEQEIRKFRWLAKQQVISEKESQRKIAAVISAHQQKGPEAVEATAFN